MHVKGLRNTGVVVECVFLFLPNIKDFSVNGAEVRMLFYFRGKQNDCNLLLFLTTKHVFENF